MVKVKLYVEINNEKSTLKGKEEILKIKKAIYNTFAVNQYVDFPIIPRIGDKVDLDYFVKKAFPKDNFGYEIKRWITEAVGYLTVTDIVICDEHLGVRVEDI